MGQVWQKKHFSFGKVKYSAGIIYLGIDYTKLLVICTKCKILMVIHCMQSTPCKESELEFRISESASAGYPHLG